MTISKTCSESNLGQNTENAKCTTKIIDLNLVSTMHRFSIYANTGYTMAFYHCTFLIKSSNKPHDICTVKTDVHTPKKKTALVSYVREA